MEDLRAAGRSAVRPRDWVVPGQPADTIGEQLQANSSMVIPERQRVDVEPNGQLVVRDLCNRTWR